MKRPVNKGFFPPFLIVLLAHLIFLIGGLNFIELNSYKTAAPRTIQVNLSQGNEVLNPVKKLTKKLSKIITQDKPQKIQSAEPLRPEVEVQKLAQGQRLSEFVKVDLRTSYQAELRQKIEENKFYPSMSKRLGHKGLVVVAFTLLRDGQIKNIRVEKPSAYESLNASAMEAVKRVEKFRPIPEELGESEMEFKIQINFFTI